MSSHRLFHFGISSKYYNTTDNFYMIFYRPLRKKQLNVRNKLKSYHIGRSTTFIHLNCAIYTNILIKLQYILWCMM